MWAPGCPSGALAWDKPLWRPCLGQAESLNPKGEEPQLGWAPDFQCTSAESEMPTGLSWNLLPVPKCTLDGRGHNFSILRVIFNMSGSLAFRRAPTWEPFMLRRPEAARQAPRAPAPGLPHSASDPGETQSFAYDPWGPWLSGSPGAGGRGACPQHPTQALPKDHLLIGRLCPSAHLIPPDVNLTLLNSCICQTPRSQ